MPDDFLSLHVFSVWTCFSFRFCEAIRILSHKSSPQHSIVDILGGFHHNFLLERANCRHRVLFRFFVSSRLDGPNRRATALFGTVDEMWLLLHFLHTMMPVFTVAGMVSLVPDLLPCACTGSCNVRMCAEIWEWLAYLFKQKVLRLMSAVVGSHTIYIDVSLKTFCSLGRLSGCKWGLMSCVWCMTPVQVPWWCTTSMWHFTHWRGISHFVDFNSRGMKSASPPHIGVSCGIVLSVMRILFLLVMRLSSGSLSQHLQ